MNYQKAISDRPKFTTNQIVCFTGKEILDQYMPLNNITVILSASSVDKQRLYCKNLKSIYCQIDFAL